MLYDLDAQQEKLVWKPDDAPLFSVPDMAFSRDGSKLALYARLIPTNSVPGDGVWVINTASLKIESHYKTLLPCSSRWGGSTIAGRAALVYGAFSSANSVAAYGALISQPASQFGKMSLTGTRD